MEEQETNACRKVGHYGMKPGVGRGAPEIDVLEAMGGDAGPLPNTPVERPYFSTSLQVSLSRVSITIAYVIFETRL
jgi:hypothetical protein